VIDILGSLIGDILMWPAEWLNDRLWEGHRKEPTWVRVVSALVRGTLTVIIFVTWIALVIGIPIAIIILVAQK
jgi:hypothetical protein